MPEGIKMNQIRLWYVAEMVPEDVISGLTEAISASGGAPLVEREEKYPMQAGLEWLAPTALVVFIAKPYFESFLTEMGKDHYNLLKKALEKAAARLLDRSAPKFRIVHSPGKVHTAATYSPAFSIYVEINSKLNIKLLFPADPTENEIQEIFEVYSSFLEDLYLGQIKQSLLDKLIQGRVVGRTMLVAYDFTTRAITPVDPIPPKHR